MCKFQQKILNSMVAGSRQSFQFIGQSSWLLKNNRASSKVLYWVWITLLVSSNNIKVSP